MSTCHFLHETAQCVQDIPKGLTGTGFRKERHEIDGMPLIHRDADLGIALESPDAWTVTGARIKNHNRRLLGIETVFQTSLVDTSDAQKRVIRRFLEASRVEDHFILEIEERRFSRAFVRNHVVRTLPKRIPEQDTALP